MGVIHLQPLFKDGAGDKLRERVRLFIRPPALRKHCLELRFQRASRRVGQLDLQHRPARDLSLRKIQRKRQQLRHLQRQPQQEPLSRLPPLRLVGDMEMQGQRQTLEKRMERVALQCLRTAQHLGRDFHQRQAQP